MVEHLHVGEESNAIKKAKSVGNPLQPVKDTSQPCGTTITDKKDQRNVYYIISIFINKFHIPSMMYVFQ